jgi:hypothetical protein
MNVSTFFESDSTRFFTFTASSATVSFQNNGVELRASSTSGSYCKIDLLTTNSIGSLFDDSSSFCSNFGAIAVANSNSEFSTWVGALSLTGASITKTGKHYGWIIDRTSGTADFQASNANGTTETNTSITASANINDFVTAIKDGNTNIKYYTGNTLDATHTTNLPSGTGSTTLLSAGICNKNNADDGDITMSYWGFSYDPTS